MLLARCPWYVAGPWLGLLLVMIFRAFSYFDTGCAAYLFGCGTRGACAVVDPRADDVSTYRAFADAKGLRDVEIHPGHFSGSLCGTGLSGKPTSPIAFEKRWNPMLSMPRDAFIEALSAVPPTPPGMDAILAFNRGAREDATR